MVTGDLQRKPHCYQLLASKAVIMHAYWINKFLGAGLTRGRKREGCFFGEC